MVTREDVEQSIIFNMTKRLMKKEYPWVIDMKLTHDPGKYDNTLFFTILVDPVLLAEQFGFTLRGYVFRNIDREDWNIYQSLCILTEESCSDPRVQQAEREIENNLRRVAASPAIPQEYKDVLERKYLNVSRYVVDGPSIKKRMGEEPHTTTT